jgi:uncharacterized protein (DUF302 family)
MTSWGIKKVLRSSFDDTLARVPDALKTEGFGILTEIDVRETLKKKLDVDFRRYRILGACNPPFAHQALLTNLEAGLMMPCNVIVYEDGEQQTVVEAVDPMLTMAAQGDPRLQGLAREVQEKLRRALDRLE